MQCNCIHIFICIICFFKKSIYLYSCQQNNEACFDTHIAKTTPYQYWQLRPAPNIRQISKLWNRPRLKPPKPIWTLRSLTRANIFSYLLLDSSSLFLPGKKHMEHQHNHFHVNWISCSKQTFLDQFLRLQKGWFQSTQPFGYQKLRHFQGPQRKTAIYHFLHYRTTHAICWPIAISRGLQQDIENTHSKIVLIILKSQLQGFQRYLFWCFYGVSSSSPVTPVATSAKASQCVRHAGWTSWMTWIWGSNKNK